jgi:integrase
MITKRDVDALGSSGGLIWDHGKGAVTGFGARRQTSDAVAYVLKYRTKDGRQRWYTIGRHGAPWTPETARSEARKILGKVAEGADPAAEKQSKRNASTVSELCDLYLEDSEKGRLLTRRKMPKAASTIETDRGRIEQHIKRLLGTMRVAAVTREDVERFMHNVAEGKTARSLKSKKKRGLARVTGGKGTATRTVGLLGAIFAYAVKHHMRSDNPVHGVTRFADGVRERRLTNDEYRQLGDALRKAAADPETIWPAAVKATWFLALTGWRRGEVLGLRRGEVDVARRTATLPDTKTGRSMRPLSHAACDVLPDGCDAEELVFPATRGEGAMFGFPKLFAKISDLGELPADVTPHVLRHSFASIAGDLGYSDLTIGALIGHRKGTVTSRYVHAADAVLLAAADKVADHILTLMGKSPELGQVVEFAAVAR